MSRFPIALLILLAVSGTALAQQTSEPVPLYQSQPPRTIEPEELPPVAPAPAAPTPPPAASPGTMAEPGPTVTPPSPLSPPAARILCNQEVRVQLADPDRVAARYRPFIGMFSDAAWTPQLCAALVVENATADGTATILYVFGPMGANDQGPGGVLHGTGIIRDGELRFQNSDGSQFSFRPLYSDLQGRLTMPQGQTYQAIFERAP